MGLRLGVLLRRMVRRGSLRLLHLLHLLLGLRRLLLEQSRPLLVLLE